MPRIPLAPTLLILASLALALAPRSLMTPVLDLLRPAAAPLMTQPADQAAVLATAYPPELFSSSLERAVAPVYAVSAGYRHELALALGTDRGIRTGDPVVLVAATAGPTPTLVGTVSSVTRGTSRVQTLADPSWRTAVRVGASSVDALLVGGLTPMLTTIPKGAPVAAGDPVISADEHLPYGMFVGTVAEIRDAPDGVLREATLALPYALAGLRAVDVIPSGDAAR